MTEITQILRKVADGDADAENQLMALVYGELRRVASAKMAGESSRQTLQPTALVHEAWLRLGGDDQPTWQNRAHFYSAAAEAMRRILIDRTRRRRAARRAGSEHPLNLDDIDVAEAQPDETLLAVNDALERLAVEDPRKADLVKLRYFAGLSVQEAAGMMDISIPTATRWWSFSRAWLAREVRRDRV
jgi:RNA polymerase sigma factor (TIGR02999 family)